MKSDQERWDKKYKSGHSLKEVSSIVSKYSHFAQKGKALDIAAGGGRNSLFLAAQGFRVDAIDISSEGLLGFEKRSKNIKTIQQDLDFAEFKTDYYDLIININFLNRDLFSKILSSLKVGGILIFETFVINPEDPENKSGINLDYYLKSNELLHEFNALRIYFYEERKQVGLKDNKRCLAGLVGRKYQ